MMSGLQCEGKIRLDRLPAEISERLSRFPGTWLEFAPEDNSIVVRHAQPAGCPAVAAVPCELISLLDSLPPQYRNSMPGGALYVKDQSGQVLRLLVERGEIRVQWANPDYSKGIAVSFETAVSGTDCRAARIDGWAALQASENAPSLIQKLIDGFEGLYPEGEMAAACGPDAVRLQFKAVNVGPKELIAKLRELADPPSSLEAELDVGSFTAGSVDQDFRVVISKGEIRTIRPSLWSNSL